jgi:hypothetical protein
LRLEEAITRLREQHQQLIDASLTDEANDLMLSLRFLEATTRGIIRP